MLRVAVIGAGPAGIVAARYLKSEGFEPTLFESGTALGGQWSANPSHSGVWPQMRTNTSRIMTSFSDLEHPDGTATYPTNQQMKAYLQCYAETFDLMPSIRLSNPVQQVAQNGRVWSVTANGREEIFDRVVVATGRYNCPRIPDVPGLASFSGALGIEHTFAYKNPEIFRGKRVLVAGAAISSLEIASDIAMLGAQRVVVTQRKQKYVLFKLRGGVPVEHVALNRFGALAAESFPPQAVSAGLKDYILTSFGSPESYGAPKPPDDVFEAGITLCQHYLPLVAEGRISVKPWMSQISGNRVQFADGSAEEFDAILFGTGFDLHLPFLSPELRKKLNVDADHIDLHHHTFHPDLPGLAFAGLFDQAGPYFAVIELQARWIAYSWSGAVPAPSKEEMESGVAQYQSRRGGPQRTMSHLNAVAFARSAQVEPTLSKWPNLTRALLFGPLSAISFRQDGRDALPDAAERYAKQASAFGAIPSPTFAPHEIAQLEVLAKARKDSSLAALAKR